MTDMDNRQTNSPGAIEKYPRKQNGASLPLIKDATTCTIYLKKQEEDNYKNDAKKRLKKAIENLLHQIKLFCNHT